jgi:hypothetical protein
MNEDVDLTFDEEEAQVQFVDIPKVSESISYVARSSTATSSNKDLAHKEQELVY